MPFGENTQHPHSNICACVCMHPLTPTTNTHMLPISLYLPVSFVTSPTLSGTNSATHTHTIFNQESPSLIYSQSLFLLTRQLFLAFTFFAFSPWKPLMAFVQSQHFIKMGERLIKMFAAKTGLELDRYF